MVLPEAQRGSRIVPTMVVMAGVSHDPVNDLTWFFRWIPKTSLRLAYVYTQIDPYRFNARAILLTIRDGVRATLRARSERATAIFCTGLLNGLIVALVSAVLPPSKKTRLLLYDFASSTLLSGNRVISSIARATLSRVDLVFCYNSSQMRVWQSLFGKDVGIEHLDLGVDPIDLSTRATNEGYIFCGGRARRDLVTFCKTIDKVTEPVVIIVDRDPLTGRYPVIPCLRRPNLSVLRTTSFSEFKKLLKSSTFVVIPLTRTRFVAGSAVCLNAMSFGKPVIGTRNPGLDDFIEDGVNGFLVSPGNSDELQSRMELLLTNSNLVKKMGENARIRAKEMSYDKVASRFLEVITSFGIIS